MELEKQFITIYPSFNSSKNFSSKFFFNVNVIDLLKKINKQTNQLKIIMLSYEDLAGNIQI